MNSITSFIVGLDAILFLVCGVRIYQSFLKSKDKSVGYFAKFFILSGIGFIIMATAERITDQLFFVKCLIITGLFLLLTGMAYLSKLIISLSISKFENLAFWMMMTCNIITVIAMVKFYLLASTRQPFFDAESGSLVLNFPSIVTLTFFVLIILIMIIPGIFFVVNTFKSQDKGVKAKGTLISLGLVFFAIGFLSCTMSRQVFSMQVSHVFLALAFLPLLGGVFYVSEKKIPQINKINKETVIHPNINW